MKKDIVDIIVVNYKSSELIEGLLASIEEESIDLRILILDNGSTKDTWDVLESINDNRVVFIRSEKNLGFTGGVNFAVKYSLNNLNPCKYFFLLNPDAVSCKNLVTDLLNVIKSDVRLAAVSPQILDLKGRQWYSGAKIQFNKGVVLNNALSDFKEERSEYEVDVFSGCAVLFDREKFIEAGMFNNDLFMYYDEADLSMRLINLGYKILYVPLLKIKHDVSYTTKKISHIKTYYMTRNKLIVFKEHLTVFHKYYFLLYQLAFHAKNFRAKCLIYHVLGYSDYLRGKKGAIK